MTTNNRPMFRGELNFLSNFYVEEFFVPVLDCFVPTAEHGFNAFKTLIPHEREAVLAAVTPREAKKLGRKVTLVKGWDTYGRHAAMNEILRAKFSLPHLAQKLLATEELELIETNTWHDNYWGSCICSRHIGENGENHLGKALMGQRFLLQLKTTTKFTLPKDLP